MNSGSQGISEKNPNKTTDDQIKETPHEDIGLTLPDDPCDTLQNDAQDSDTIKYYSKCEPLSCYCSASHTDNISTDEHDSLHANSDPTEKVLQLSDSGADLTADVGCSNTPWQQYWALNGERLIWQSWIGKYSAYINPDYLKPQDSGADPFEDEEPRENNEPPDERNRMLIRNLSYSDSYDKLNREIEGWNPLSPVSNDCETEAERLLSSRCASHTGSSARTVDSMTNVTRMTVSSFDLSESSKSDSFSSVSSVQSSLTSTSSEEVEESENHEQEWNLLWAKHYEEEYLEHYRKFIHQNRSLESVQEAESDYLNTIDLKVRSFNKETKKESFKSLKARGKSCSNSSENLRVDKLSLADEICYSCNNLMDSSESTTLEGGTPGSVDNGGDTENIEYVCSTEDQSAMKSMGIPIAFKSAKSNMVCAKTPPLKRSIEEDDPQASSNRIKAAFALLGIEMHVDKNKQLQGSLEYKVKHIRSQNRRLQLRNTNQPTSKHIYFDEEGEPMSESSEVAVKYSHQDELLGTVPSSSAENEPATRMEEAQEEEVQEVLSKKKKRKKKSNVPVEIRENPNLKKFWHRRYSLFSKFDQGIKLDEESWFSVTPEIIAQHTAQRCKCGVIIDAFCGAGGNAIQFALTCQKVIAIDIDPKKIELARHNACVYGVEKRIEFIVGDFFKLAASLIADAVFLSPPWGGIDYLNSPVYDLELLQPQPFSQLMSAAKSVTDNIALFLPKNCNTYPLAVAAGSGGKMEIEQNFLGKRLIAITAYYGDLMKDEAK